MTRQEDWERLGARIREKREALGYSRRRLSELAGVSEKSIQVAEEGRMPRSRWPQSLRLIEAALGWAPESMRRILEGGTPEPQSHPISAHLTATSGMVVNEIIATSARGRSAAENESLSVTQRSEILTQIPEEIRNSLDDVLRFGFRARAFGANPALADEYGRIVEALILSLAQNAKERPEWPLSAGVLEPWMSAMVAEPLIEHRNAEVNRRAREAERLLTEKQKAAFLQRWADTVAHNIVEGLHDRGVTIEKKPDGGTDQE